MWLFRLARLLCRRRALIAGVAGLVGWWKNRKRETEEGESSGKDPRKGVLPRLEPRLVRRLDMSSEEEQAPFKKDPPPDPVKAFTKKVVDMRGPEAEMPLRDWLSTQIQRLSSKFRKS